MGPTRNHVSTYHTVEKEHLDMPPKKRTAKKVTAGSKAAPARKTRKKAAEEDAALARKADDEKNGEENGEENDENHEKNDKDGQEDHEKEEHEQEGVEVNEPQTNEHELEEKKELEKSPSEQKDEGTVTPVPPQSSMDTASTEDPKGAEIAGSEASKVSKTIEEVELVATVEESTIEPSAESPKSLTGPKGKKNKKSKKSRKSDSDSLEKLVAVSNDDIPQYADDSDTEMATESTKDESLVVLDDRGSPNQTLYVNNLNDKIQKEDLKRSLYLLFSSYGHILDIVAVKSPKMRGQAHIVFAEIANATLALRSLQGFNMFGKEMKIAYAKSKSDVVAQLDGTFKIPEPPALKDSRLPVAAFEQQDYDV